MNENSDRQRALPCAVRPNASSESRARCVALVCALAFAACGDATTPEHGGTYVATVNAPATHVNGAAVVELAGAGVDTVLAVSGRVFVERVSRDLTRVVIVNDVPGALQFNLRVARGSEMPRATLIEVADGDDELRALNGYTVSFAR